MQVHRRLHDVAPGAAAVRRALDEEAPVLEDDVLRGGLQQMGRDLAALVDHLVQDLAGNHLSGAGSALNWALVGDLFGRKKFATIRGILAPMYNAALFATPVAAGWVFDETGSYDIVLLTGGGLFFAAAIVFFSLQAPVRDVLDVAARARARALSEKQD